MASLAILDDYAGVAEKHFAGIKDLSVKSYPRTLNPQEETGLQQLAEQLRPYQVISTMRERTPFPAALLRQLFNLKLLLTTGVRNASLDLSYTAEHGIIVAGTKGARPGNPDHSKPDDLPPPPGYDSTTQQTFALLLSLCSRIPHDNAALRCSNAWQSGMAVALGGKTLGVVGLGKLGSNAARIASLGFGMKVIAWSSSLTQDKADEAAKGAGLPSGTYRVVTKDELFKSADVVSLHYVLSPRSRGIVGEHELSLMREHSLLVNSARGPLIDEDALWQTLNEGRIRGAALDVWWQEPLPADSRWREYNGKSDLVMSPHMGYVNEGTMNRWYEEQAENVRRWLANEEVLNKL